MKVFVIRHGESTANNDGVWTGWANPELTQKGIGDAKRAGEFLNKFSFDKIFSSDLARAVQTAKNAVPGCNPEVTDKLREVNVGNIAGKPYDVVTDAQKEIIRKDGYIIFNGESKEEFKKRITDFKLYLETLDCQNVAIFTHAGWLRNFIDEVADTFIPRNNVYCGNCATAVFDFSENKWKLHSYINLF